jgi:hypothetical protein
MEALRQGKPQSPAQARYRLRRAEKFYQRISAQYQRSFRDRDPQDQQDELKLRVDRALDNVRYWREIVQIHDADDELGLGSRRFSRACPERKNVSGSDTQWTPTVKQAERNAERAEAARALWFDRHARCMKDAGLRDMHDNPVVPECVIVAIRARAKSAGMTRDFWNWVADRVREDRFYPTEYAERFNKLTTAKKMLESHALKFVAQTRRESRRAQWPA